MAELCALAADDFLIEPAAAALKSSRQLRFYASKLRFAGRFAPAARATDFARGQAYGCDETIIPSLWLLPASRECSRR